jgi:hypothetical protein
MIELYIEDLDNIWKEAVVAYHKVLVRHLPEMSEEN